jgi:hypothetical protein
VICPPDVLCRWLRQEERWETMEELANALEREAGLRKAYDMTNRRGKIQRMMSLACPKRRRLG